MKKIFTLLCLSAFVATAFAQSSYYVFCDKDGNVYEDGATITCGDAEKDDFGEVQVPSGLYVKNVDASSKYQVSVRADIKKIDNGALQLCFPMNCLNYDKTGVQTETAKTSLAEGETKNMQTEWLPTAYGECSVTYSVFTYQSVIKKATHTITVNYRYADPSAVGAVNAASKTAAQTLCDLQGRRLPVAGKGICLVRMADGSIRKVMTK